MNFNHFDGHGNAIMVDVGDKLPTVREATARGRITVSPTVFSAIATGTAKKGDVLAVARVAGIMGVKRTSELIPMCHPLMITKATVDFHLVEEHSYVEAICTVKTEGKTGVEMEALQGVTTALLTIYDMCKAMDKSMELGSIYLEQKTGGKSGVWRNER